MFTFFITSCGVRNDILVHPVTGIMVDQSFDARIVTNNGIPNMLYTRGLFGKYIDENAKTLAWVPAEKKEGDNWVVLIGVPGKILPFTFKLANDASGWSLIDVQTAQQNNSNDGAGQAGSVD